MSSVNCKQNILQIRIPSDYKSHPYSKGTNVCMVAINISLLLSLIKPNIEPILNEEAWGKVKQFNEKFPALEDRMMRREECDQAIEEVITSCALTVQKCRDLLALIDSDPYLIIRPDRECMVSENELQLFRVEKNYDPDHPSVTLSQRQSQKLATQEKQDQKGYTLMIIALGFKFMLKKVIKDLEKQEGTTKCCPCC